MNKIVHLVIIWLRTVAAVPKPDDMKFNSILHNDKHFTSEHNVQYDQAAFLGEDDAKTFQHLSPIENKHRLGLTFDRIDKDNDGFVSLSELKRWIEFVQRRYIDEDVARVWRKHNPANLSTIAWNVYQQNVYGFLDNLSKEELEMEKNGVSYKTLITRDRRRWGVADKNLDNLLSREEFTAFLYPEEHPEMREVVLIETVEDIDKNQDGMVSVEEYIGDMYRPTEQSEEEPDWVITEREAFSKFRDIDGDGFMNLDEIRVWVVPNDYNHPEAEAKHLMFEADTNNDQLLSKDEMLDKYDVFVGSQATNFGEELGRHDEF